MGIILDYKQGEIAESFAKSQPLPAGLYPATMVSYEEGMAASSGQPKVTVRYHISADAPAGAGRTVIKDYSLIPKAVWRWTNDMVALGGTDADYFDGNSKVDVVKVCESNVNRKGILQLAEPDEGFSNNNVTKVRPSRNGS